MGQVIPPSQKKQLNEKKDNYQLVDGGLVFTIRKVDMGEMQPKKHKTCETNVHQLFSKLFSNEHVNLMYINCSPINIDLNDSPLLTFIFMFFSLFVANISLFIVLSLSVH